MNITPVANKKVWTRLKTLFIGASLIFLINIYFGFDNSLTVGEIPRWQRLIHLHGGSVGWITLSAIGIAIWVLTGERDVSEKYEKQVNTLIWAAVLVFAGYVPTFGFAFSRPSGFLVTLLPIFGAAAVIILWISTFFTLSQLGKKTVTTTVDILAASALLVAAIGATVGMLFGLERAIGQFLPLPQADRVGAHAAMMDTYLFLVAGATIEWFTREDKNKRWSIAGIIQAVAWIISASLVPIAFFLNMVDQLLPLFGILLLLGLIVFIGRVAWRVLIKGPGGVSPQGWAFMGTIWLIVYLGLFLWFISSGADFAVMPTWYGPVFAHAGFVGMMTNLLLGVQAVRARSSQDVLPWGESAALWSVNIGLLIFFGLKIAADIRWGAALMGIAVLFGVFVMFQRLRASE